ncbi:hypothetical protein FT663_01014 [Candidozyma haemuli var. vulneris]|uniref:Protein SUR7 n=1 Tax=Candidozyma haemuli TaxID=45357 RepID=A0A2V1AWP1_9ASCO|nr:hypothetical protein CXQ85_000744 [[Candida] haemuloni]KAF3991703.1 hypothetical protein FT662_01585 [[Candida] haemuloni var. vulneris]KAF3994909.1 hypothetical protein FT663_01014 [[Candida] haemuloni var. vulneris]PVH21753.1 hypothetical protein CXQ85_000744 [[Candida] haemuloni]
MLRILGTFANLILLAGTTLLLIFIVLGGAVNHFPFHKFDWLHADTSSIDGAYSQSKWYFWGVCDADDRSQCHLGPAYALSPYRNFETESGVPQDFISDDSTYFYLSRFAFAFFIIGFVFTALAFLIDVLGFCFDFAERLIIALVTLGLFFVAGFAAFQTAVAVLARNAFRDEGYSADIGVQGFAIMWTSVACLLIVWIISCANNIATSYKKHLSNVQGNEGYYHQQQQQGQDGELGDDSSFTRSVPVEKDANAGSGGIRFFRIKRNQKPSDEESV